MGRVSVAFEAENQDELIGDIKQFLSNIVGIAAVEVSPPPSEEKPKKTRKRKEKAPAPPEPPAEDDPLGLNAGGDDNGPPVATYEDVVQALQGLIEGKGQDVAIQVMEEFGGSTKMIEVPEENYGLLCAEAKKATSG